MTIAIFKMSVQQKIKEPELPPKFIIILRSFKKNLFKIENLAGLSSWDEMQKAHFNQNIRNKATLATLEILFYYFL